jgi:hypothetical protein
MLRPSRRERVTTPPCPSRSRWSVSRGAAVVSGANGAGRALALSPGESIQTPSTCVNTSYPTFRLFAKNSQGVGTVLVQAVYKLAPLNLPVLLPVGVITLNGTWSPTLPMLNGSVAAGLLSKGTANLSLRFTALTGTTAIDDSLRRSTDALTRSGIRAGVGRISGRGGDARTARRLR